MTENHQPQACVSNRPALDLDTPVNARTLAPWLGITPKRVLEYARSGRIPSMRLGTKVIRFHPRTVLAALNARSL